MVSSGWVGKSQKTVEEEILDTLPEYNRREARNICGIMMFEGDNALKKISVLSGGEKSRVLLGKLLATPANLLLLDEPTNHLDMESIDSLLEVIDAFEGAGHTGTLRSFRKGRRAIHKGSLKIHS